ncbi:MAG TPA: hypothetical protein VI111_04240 [Thermoleophilaceae bacterium]
MKLSLAAVCAAVIVLTASAAASAATLVISPSKSCYRSGESFSMSATGFTPGAPVNVTVNGSTLMGSPLTADAAGGIGSGLTLGQRTGEQRKTLVTTDATNQALTASATLLVSAVSVNVKPKNGAAGRKVKIGARGFTTGKTLYAHISKGHKLIANVRIGKLKGACRTAKAKRQLFAADTKSGTYTVQFDSARKRSSKTAVKSVYTVTIYPIVRSSRASAASAGGGRAIWTPAG